MQHNYYKKCAHNTFRKNLLKNKRNILNMETPSGTIDIKFLDALATLVHEFENEFYPFDKDNVRIYMSKAIEMMVCYEAGKTWNHHPTEIKKFMGYLILPDYNHRITIVDIQDVEFKRIKQLRIETLTIKN